MDTYLFNANTVILQYFRLSAEKCKWATLIYESYRRRIEKSVVHLR